MPGIPADQLPADLRKRLGIATGTGRGRRAGSRPANERETERPAPSRVARKVDTDDEPIHLRCHTCGEEFRYTKGPRGYEHHQETTGHLRYEVVTTTP